MRGVTSRAWWSVKSSPMWELISRVSSPRSCWAIQLVWKIKFSWVGNFMSKEASEHHFDHQEAGEDHSNCKEAASRSIEWVPCGDGTVCNFVSVKVRSRYIFGDVIKLEIFDTWVDCWNGFSSRVFCFVFEDPIERLNLVCCCIFCVKGNNDFKCLFQVSVKIFEPIWNGDYCWEILL